MHMAEIVLITGLSGAGRSAAADVLEDLGWYVVDNLPDHADQHDHRPGGEAGQRHRSPGARRRSSTPRVAPPRRRGPRERPSCHRGLPRRVHRRAGSPIRRHPPPAPARRPGRRARRVDRTRTRAARSGTGCRRPRHRHDRPQRAPAQGAPRRGVRRVDPTRGCRSRSRASGSSTACRSMPTWSWTCASSRTRTGSPSCGP